MRTYNTNHDFFENINCPEKAYILGFFTGDGNLFKRSSWTLQFVMHQQDIEILEQIKNIIIPDKPIQKWIMTQVTGYQTPCAALRITSNKMGEDLIKLGIGPAKTGKENFPDLPKHLYPDYIRGVFDADGCIATIKRQYKNNTNILYKYSIRCKNQNFLKKINNTIGKLGSVYKHDNCPVLEISNRYNICLIGKFMYYDKNILCLSRKKNRFDNMPKPYLFEAFGELKTYNNWLKDDRMQTKQSEFYRRLSNTKMTLEECMTMPIKQYTQKKYERKIQKMGIYPIEEFPKIGYL